jgi:ribosomal protein L13
MFKKLIVVDGQGHLLGRLASYVAKALLNGKHSLIQALKSLLSELKASISLAHSSETKSSSLNSSTKDYLPTHAGLSYTTELPPKFSGEP